MSETLLELWQSKPAFFEGKSVRQVIQFAGDGRLRDGNPTSCEFRGWLAAIPLDRLRRCAEDCLESTFEDSGHALQDIVNQIGVRLGFIVEPGRYRGVRGEIGNDGLWRAKDGHALLLEVKTTDTYRINLDTVAEYRVKLIAENALKDDASSILIAVGRQDTGDLEAQIRGSRHAWDVRLVSVDSLLRLAEVKEQVSDWATSNQINQVLRPVEYTRVDGIVELLFATSRDIESPEPERPDNNSKPRPATEATTAPKSDLERARESAISRAERHLKTTLVRKGKALRGSSDGSINVVCLASQRYEGPAGSGNYWYGFTPAQRDFLSESKAGWLVLACGDGERAFLVDRETLFKWLPGMLTTPPKPANVEEIRHWHIYFNDYGDRVEMMPTSITNRMDLVRFLLA